MTAVFRIGLNGNGTVYYGKTEKEIKQLVSDYKKRGYTVQPLKSSMESQKWFQID